LSKKKARTRGIPPAKDRDTADQGAGKAGAIRVAMMGLANLQLRSSGREEVQVARKDLHDPEAKKRGNISVAEIQAKIRVARTAHIGQVVEKVGTARAARMGPAAGQVATMLAVVLVVEKVVDS
jgi:hypothetical protein